MGARAQIKVTDTDADPVYLYTHWGAGTIEEDVRVALARKQRWDHYGYLTRILFDGIKGTDVESETGYGIGTSEHGDIELLVEILPGQKVKIGNSVWTFDQYIQQTFEVD